MTLCGRPACICLYRTRDCYFCDVAREVLVRAIKDTGIKGVSYTEVDIDKNPMNGLDESLALPAISICDTILTGIPDLDSLSTTLNRYIHKDCFAESGI
ncbi:MAG: hypothetical protein BAJATHORv1_10202 [Candidatus Thorarchaeota archaeon]|nr:MAG: hypothetical protein BAJATHORv1_10202 [Candidatus Thorarchaeota archaeon]